MKPVKQNLTHRQRQALATRMLIVATSRELFLQQGYGTTTIDTIAVQAGVAVSTVYAIFKNKRGILRAIREAWHEESGQHDLYQAALEETEGGTRLELAARATRRQWETGASMITIYRGAASIDPEAAAELEEALQGRRAHLDHFIEASQPLFHPALTRRQATAIFRALCLAEVYEELVHHGGWSPEEYEQWLATALKQQLLTGSAR
jgi:AcrR family transcriptional regulator